MNLELKYFSVKLFLYSEGDSPGWSEWGEEGKPGDYGSDERAWSRWSHTKTVRRFVKVW